MKLFILRCLPVISTVSILSICNTCTPWSIKIGKAGLPENNAKCSPLNIKRFVLSSYFLRAYTEKNT